MHKNSECEYLTIQELASIVSHRAAALRAEGVEVKSLGTLIRELIMEHPYASANAIGRELSLHRQQIKQEEIKGVIQVLKEERDLEDAQRHEAEMLEGFKEAGHDPDDI